MNIDKALRGLKARVELTGLRCYDTIPTSVVAPCAVLTVGAGEYDTLGDATACEMRVMVLLPMAEIGQAQRSMWPYLSATGSKSVRAAVSGAPTLPYDDDAQVGSAVVSGWEQPGAVEVGGDTYLGCELIVSVYD